MRKNFFLHPQAGNFLRLLAGRRLRFTMMRFSDKIRYSLRHSPPPPLHVSSPSQQSNEKDNQPIVFFFTFFLSGPHTIVSNM